MNAARAMAYNENMKLESQPCSLVCRSCQALLVPFVEPIDLDELNSREAGQTIVPRGAVTVERTETGERWVLNPNDVAGTHLTTDRTRLVGCCGPDGNWGANRLCACGAEVGTEASACWQTHAIYLDPALVERRAAVGSRKTAEQVTTVPPAPSSPPRRPEVAAAVASAIQEAREVAHEHVPQQAPKFAAAKPETADSLSPVLSEPTSQPVPSIEVAPETTTPREPELVFQVGQNPASISDLAKTNDTSKRNRKYGKKKARANANSEAGARFGRKVAMTALPIAPALIGFMIDASPQAIMTLIVLGVLAKRAIGFVLNNSPSRGR